MLETRRPPRALQLADGLEWASVTRGASPSSMPDANSPKIVRPLIVEMIKGGEDMDTTKTKLAPQEKIALAREGYAALNAGDIEKGLTRFSEDLVFHSPVFPQPLGKDGLRAATKRIVDTTDEYSLEAHHILANDDHIVALLVVHGRRGDRVC